MAKFYVNLGKAFKGSSEDAKHKEWVVAECVNLTITNNTNKKGGGTPDFKNIDVLHYYDGASPSILNYCAKAGTAAGVLPEVTIDVCASEAGGDETVMRVVLKNVRIVGTSTTFAGDRPMESFTLSFVEFGYTCQMRSQDGKSTGWSSGAWNTETNMEATPPSAP
ncbi:MAG: type VI secretion system tube protein Hcp [Betaproteobacteria bacterium]|nr:type VI secretion system tube protein Hcp [Betaproteobacteria bacterium]